MLIPFKHSTLLGTETALAASAYQIKKELILTSSACQFSNLKASKLISQDVQKKC